MKKCMGCFFPQKSYCKFLFCKKVKQKYYTDIDRFRAKIQGDSDMGLVCLPWCSDLNGSDFLNTNNTKIYISTNPISVMATTRCIKSFTCYTDVTLITFASIHTYHNSGAYLGVRSYFQASTSISWERETRKKCCLADQFFHSFRLIKSGMAQQKKMLELFPKKCQFIFAFCWFQSRMLQEREWKFQ